MAKPIAKTKIIISPAHISKVILDVISEPGYIVEKISTKKYIVRVREYRMLKILGVTDLEQKPDQEKAIYNLKSFIQRKKDFKQGEVPLDSDEDFAAIATQIIMFRKGVSELFVALDKNRSENIDIVIEHTQEKIGKKTLPPGAEFDTAMLKKIWGRKFSHIQKFARELTGEYASRELKKEFGKVPEKISIFYSDLHENGLVP